MCVCEGVGVVCGVCVCEGVCVCACVCVWGVCACVWRTTIPPPLE